MDHQSVGVPRPIFQPSSPFLKLLQQRAGKELGDRLLKGDSRLLRKAAVIVAWFSLSYALMLAPIPLWAQFGFSISYGLAAAALGFNIFHDANHGAFASRADTNLWISILCSMALGPSRHLWTQKHHVFHHQFTNVHGWDDDVEIRRWARLTPDAPWNATYRGQQYYIFILYAFTTLEWFFVKDFIQYATQRLNHHQPIPLMTVRQRVEFWICKAIYIAGFVMPPLLLLPIGNALFLLAVFHATFGLMLALVFNIAHEVVEVTFPRPGSDQMLGTDWAAHQLWTTSNFANASPLWNWFTGGLNRQIEHHLFPNISHTHYPSLAEVVRKAATEFGLPYVSFPRYRDALASHRKLLHVLGQAPHSAPRQSSIAGSRA